MPDAAKRNLIPPPTTDDHEDVSWALSTAEATWSRGEHADALKWLRRAAEAASEAEDDDRALALAKAAAELVTELDAPKAGGSAPPPAPDASPSASRPPPSASSSSMSASRSVPAPASASRPPPPASSSSMSASRSVPAPASASRPSPPLTSATSGSRPPPPPLAAFTSSSPVTTPSRPPPAELPPARAPSVTPSVGPPRPSSAPRPSQGPSAAAGPAPRPVTGGLRPQAAKVDPPRGSATPASGSVTRPSGVPRPPVAPAPKLEPPREASRSAPPKNGSLDGLATPAEPRDGGSFKDTFREPHNDRPSRLPPEPDRASLQRSRHAEAEDTILMRRPDPSDRPSEPETPESKRALSPQVPKAGRLPTLSTTGTDEVDMDAWPTQATGRGRGDLSYEDEPKTRIGAPAYTDAPAYLEAHDRVTAIPGDRPSQAVRVIVWRAADGVHVAPHGTTVSAISVDAMLVALDPTADLYAWLSGK